MDILQTILSRDLAFTKSYLAVFRILAPLLAIILLWRCCRPLLTFRREPEIWGFLCFKDGKKQPITHWESIIGRHQQSDLVVDFPTVSRNHAVLTRYDDGSWTITDTDSKDGVEVNGKKVTICPITEADTISIGGVEMKLEPVSEEQEEKLTQQRTKASTGVDSIANLLLLSVFQALTCLGFLLGGSTENALSIFTGFAGIMCLQWVLLFMYFIIRRPAFEVETAAFFLCTLGMAAICTVHPEETVKQLIALILGLLLFLTVVVLIGGKKGFMSCLGLAFTLCTVICFLLPSLFEGGNALAVSVLTVVLSTAVSCFCISFAEVSFSAARITRIRALS